MPYLITYQREARINTSQPSIQHEVTEMTPAKWLVDKLNENKPGNKLVFILNSVEITPTEYSLIRIAKFNHDERWNQISEEIR